MVARGFRRFDIFWSISSYRNRQRLTGFMQSIALKAVNTQSLRQSYNNVGQHSHLRAKLVEGDSDPKRLFAETSAIVIQDTTADCLSPVAVPRHRRIRGGRLIQTIAKAVYFFIPPGFYKKFTQIIIHVRVSLTSTNKCTSYLCFRNIMQFNVFVPVFERHTIKLYNH